MVRRVIIAPVRPMANRSATKANTPPSHSARRARAFQPRISVRKIFAYQVWSIPGDGLGAENDQGNADNGQAGERGPAVGEQHGDVTARFGVEFAAGHQRPRQVLSQHDGRQHQEGDEAQREHRGELKRAVDEAQFTKSCPDPARQAASR
jgi:hypothetical protein